MAAVFANVTRDLAIKGRANLHRLRHTFATTFLPAGMSLTGIKQLLGDRDIRITLGFAAVTQESLRNEYFALLNKIEHRYEVTSYRLKTPDLKQGVSRALYDTVASVKKLRNMGILVNLKQIPLLDFPIPNSLTRLKKVALDKPSNFAA